MSNYEILKNNVGLKIYASIVEDIARKQIDLIVDHPAIKGLVAIMPDVHAGVGSVVGLTCRFKESVIPNIVGVDLGCGVLNYRLDSKEIDFAKLDSYIRKNVPTGFNSRSCNWIDSQHFYDITKMPRDVGEAIYEVNSKAEEFLKENGLLGNTTPSQQMGTLGGGNHFIEVEKGYDGDLYLTSTLEVESLGWKLPVIINVWQKI